MTVTFKPCTNTVALNILFIFVSFFKILSSDTSGTLRLLFNLSYCPIWDVQIGIHSVGIDTKEIISTWKLVLQHLLLQHQLTYCCRLNNEYIFALHYVFFIFLSSFRNVDFYLIVSWRCLLKWWPVDTSGFGSTWMLNCCSLEYTNKMLLISIV